MTTLKDRVVGVAGVCSYTCKLRTFFVMPLTLPIIPISKKYLFREHWKNLSNCGYPILRYFCCGPKYLNTYFIDHPDFGIHLLVFQNRGFTVHKNDFLCNTRFLSAFPRAHCRDIFFRKLAWVMSGA